MKMRIIISLVLLFAASLLSCPAKAQWDLNGTAANTMGSAGSGNVLGNVQPNMLNANGSPGQAYINEPNAIQPSHGQTQYNQYGTLQNGFGQLQNTAYQQFGQLVGTYTPRLSPIQNFNLPAGLQGTMNGLPPTSLDSFVRNAGGHAEAIYGDEGTNSWPPLNGFGPRNTINAGIVGQRSKTITTGHGGSKLPTASGNGSSIAP